MTKLMNRAKYVCGGEQGASNVEIVVWISVVLLVAIGLFAFKDRIRAFLTNSGTQVDGMNVQVDPGN